MLKSLVLGGVAMVVAACGSQGSQGNQGNITSCHPARNGQTGTGHYKFNLRACENSSLTAVRLPLHRGVSHGRSVWYVIMDASNAATAKRLGINYVPKLRNAIGTAAVQKISVSKGVIDFPATVNFKPKRVVVPGPSGFPLARFGAPAVGETGYSPLIELPDGTVLNAPQVLNWTGRADKVEAVDPHDQWVRYFESHGFYEDKIVHYASFDASIPVAAALEDVTYAPALQSAPRPGNEDLGSSSREELVAFTDGPSAKDSSFKQGLNAAVLDGIGPDNLLHEVPPLPLHPDVGDVRYTPLWDAHLATWTQKAIDGGDRVELRSVDEVDDRVKEGLITAPGGKPFGASGFIVDCPLISTDLP